MEEKQLRIGNPIYDVFFKYLIEDTEIARRLISAIIGEEIIELAMLPQEQLSRSELFELTILRLDFSAIIKNQNGENKKVLIELQKGKKPGDIFRFRRYLGGNYQKENIVKIKKKKKSTSLPILTIYFLGFNLKSIETPVVKVNREYVDLINSKKIDTKEDFIEKLTHDSFIIQIKRMENPARTELERVLQIFNQSFIAYDTDKILEIKEQELKESELLNMMALRLRNAASNENIWNNIELIEDVESVITHHIRLKQIAREEAEIAKEEAETAKEEIEAAKEKIEAAKEEIEAAKEEIEAAKEEIEAAKEEAETVLQKNLDLKNEVERLKKLLNSNKN